MPLKYEYPDDFEELYSAWPKWPKGRTKKHATYRMYLQCRRQFCFERKDILELLECIETMKRTRKSWQPGSDFGPVAMQRWLGPDRLFLQDLEGDYEKVGERKMDKWDRANEEHYRESPEEAMAKLRPEVRAAIERGEVH